MSKNMKTIRPPCPACGATPWLSGYKVNKHDVGIEYQCPRCGTSFTRRADWFRGYKNSSAAIMYAVLRYHTHPSLQKIRGELARLGCHITQTTILHWLEKYDRQRRKLSPRLQRMPSHPRQMRRLRRKIREAYH